METEFGELSFRQIAVILRLTFPPDLSLKVCKILMLYYYYFWGHVGLKLLFSVEVTLPKNREKFQPDKSLYSINLEICFKKQL